jgi:DNA-binding transcriptional regulator GbsR (MarR family)
MLLRMLIFQGGQLVGNLSKTEQSVIELFVAAADALALPRSVGELYGLLFVSEEPLCMDDCMSRLEISKGSVSQGLRMLRAIGAVKVAQLEGSRRDYFVAETELRKMIGGFVKERINPRLASGRARIADALESAEAEASSESVVVGRLVRLAGWHRKFEKSLPLALKLIGE